MEPRPTISLWQRDLAAFEDALYGCVDWDYGYFCFGRFMHMLGSRLRPEAWGYWA